jgi:hypothetical protein
MLGAVLLLAALAGAPAAHADFTHATLLSGTSEQEFEDAGAPALSQSGEYVAFQGSLAGVSGVYRRDLQSGAVELVADGAAAAPSISANGQYVAFTTTQILEPLKNGEGEPPQDGGCPEVYVRNMNIAVEEPGAYVLASALNKSREGIAFEGKLNCGGGSGLPVSGAQAAPAVALSANGESVVFTLLSESNLVGAKTPPGQVAVRDMASETTTLVTTEGEGEGEPKPVAGGGAFPDSYSLSQLSGLTITPETSSAYGNQPAGSSAAISADGSTVAWVGMNVSKQVSAAEAVREPAVDESSGESEAEPLWRRIADPQPVTRRLLAGAGLAFFASSNPTEPPNPVEHGAFIGTTKTAFVPPALSANGETVGLVATAPPLALLPSLTERLTGLSAFSSDAYAVRVNDDPSVAPQVTPLTKITSYAAQQYALESVKDVAVSPDGKRIAFDTERTPLESPSLSLVSPFSAPYVAEVYEANLELGTLQRVTAAYDEAELNGSMELLSVAADDQTLAFGSSATNLFFGDGVDAPEIYEIHELPVSTTAVPTQIGETPILPLPTPKWLLSATAVTQPDGSVLVSADVPAAGRLGVEADAQLPARSTVAVKKRRQGRREYVRATRAKAAVAGHIVTRAVARNALNVATPSDVQLSVRVSSVYRTLVSSADGLYTVLRVTFSAPGHATLVEQIPVTLRDRKSRTVAARRSKRKARTVANSGKRGKPGPKE